MADADDSTLIMMNGSTSLTGRGSRSNRGFGVTLNETTGLGRILLKRDSRTDTEADEGPPGKAVKPILPAYQRELGVDVATAGA